MRRYLMGLLFLGLAVIPAGAHFVWILPDEKDATKVRVVFSDALEPDDGVAIEKIAATKLLARTAGRKDAPVEMKKGEHAYLVHVPAKEAGVIGGTCRYGVSQRGKNKPFLLVYHPKLVRGELKEAKPWDKLPLEIVPLAAGRFRVVWGGKGVEGSEVVATAPDGKKETLKTGPGGEFKVGLAAPGLYGIRARHVEAKPGEAGGKKYEEARHYATLVFRVAKSAAKAAEFPPLPRAVSSLGAAAADGWLYVYGGHCGRTHQYSTEAVVGTFQRVKLSDPKAWEPLPGGPLSQGLALVAHKGKLYRIGGMQPRNKPGEKADNHSLASCACYDPVARRWEALPDLPAARSSHDAVVVGDSLYVVGGWKMTGAGNKPQWHDTALVLDLASKPLRWKTIKQPFHRRALTAAAHDGKVYVIAGLNDEAEMELGVEIYDPATGAWSSGASIPGPIRNGFTPASCVAGGRLHLSTADGKVWRLAETGKSWDEVGKLKQPRIVHRMVADGDGRLVVVGGASRQGNVSLVEAVECDCCVKPAAEKVSADPTRQTLCPIMTGMPVDPDSPAVEYRGVKVLLCCQACVRRWKADPEAYLDAKLLPQLARQTLPERTLKQVYCPVYRDRVVSEKGPSVTYQGKKVYLFNQNAVRRWSADPQRYADVKLLPQLAAR